MTFLTFVAVTFICMAQSAFWLSKGGGWVPLASCPGQILSGIGSNPFNTWLLLESVAKASFATSNPSQHLVYRSASSVIDMDGNTVGRKVVQRRFVL